MSRKSMPIDPDAANRIKYIIDTYCSGDCPMFAEKAKINLTSAYQIRAGKKNIYFYAERILEAFPFLSRSWLLSGTGSPNDIDGGKEDTIILKLQKEIGRLNNEMKLKDNIIELLKENIAFYRHKEEEKQ